MQWARNSFLKAKTFCSLMHIDFPLCLKELIEADKLRSVIERTYPLSKVAAAHGDSQKGRVVGKLVMTVTDLVDGQK
jgi:hypothetical protein